MTTRSNLWNQNSTKFGGKAVICFFFNMEITFYNLRVWVTTLLPVIFVSLIMVSQHVKTCLILPLTRVDVGLD